VRLFEAGHDSRLADDEEALCSEAESVVLASDSSTAPSTRETRSAVSRRVGELSRKKPSRPAIGENYRVGRPPYA